MRPLSTRQNNMLISVLLTRVMFPPLQSLGAQASRRTARQERKARKAREGFDGSRHRLIEYGMDRDTAREFLWRVQTHINQRINSQVYDVLWVYLTGAYDDKEKYTDKDVEQLLQTVSDFWDVVLVKLNVPGAERKHGLFREHMHFRERALYSTFFKVLKDLRTRQGTDLYNKPRSSTSRRGRAR